MRGRASSCAGSDRTALAGDATARECAPVPAQAGLDDESRPRIATTDGVRDLATFQIETFERAKEVFGACLRGQSRADALAEIDRAIKRVERARRKARG